MAQNPDVIQTDGSINMSTSAPLMFPMDLSSYGSAAPSGSSSAAPAATSAASAPATSPSSAGNSSSGAGRSAVSGGLFAVAVLAASFLAL